jgi:hypothetical protein
MTYETGHIGMKVCPFDFPVTAPPEQVGSSESTDKFVKFFRADY